MTDRPFKKIVNLEALSILCATYKQSGQKFVLCHGCFDLLHYGHLQHFKAAKKLGDILAVTITPDNFVNKGPLRPVFPEVYRMEFIAELETVDYVALNQWETAVETIKLVRPNYFVKGSDYKVKTASTNPNIVLEEKAIKSVGGEMVYTDEVSFSSSHLLRYISSSSST